MIYRQQVLILFLLFNYCLGLGSSIPFIGCSIRCALQCPGGYCELFSRYLFLIDTLIDIEGKKESGSEFGNDFKNLYP